MLALRVVKILSAINCSPNHLALRLFNVSPVPSFHSHQYIRVGLSTSPPSGGLASESLSVYRLKTVCIYSSNATFTESSYSRYIHDDTNDYINVKRRPAGTCCVC